MPLKEFENYKQTRLSVEAGKVSELIHSTGAGESSDEVDADVFLMEIVRQ